jgi:hypothetical protein
MMIILEPAPQLWTCPNCPATARTTRQANRFHNCGGLSGLLAPMVPAGTVARVTAVVRDDYVNREDVRYDASGRPVTGIITEYADGRSDVVAFAPTAYVRGDL